MENKDSNNINNNNNNNNNSNKECENSDEMVKECVKNLQMKGYASIEFSVDLVKATYLSLLALDYLHDTEELRVDSAIEYSLLRYRQFLCLKHKIQSNSSNDSHHEFVPPPDVQVLWGTHQIRQEKYRNDLTKRFGTWFDHFPYSRECYKDEIIQSTKQWEDEYPTSTYLPNFETHQQYLEVHKSLIDDVQLSIGVAEVHEDYKYISLCKQHYPNYHDPRFIERCVEKYKKYLYMNALQKQEGIWKASIGPKIDTDSAWHAHQQCGRAYEHDLLKNIGFIFYHIPNSEAERDDDAAAAAEAVAKAKQSIAVNEPQSNPQPPSKTTVTLINIQPEKRRCKRQPPQKPKDTPKIMMCRRISTKNLEKEEKKCKRVQPSNDDDDVILKKSEKVNVNKKVEVIIDDEAPKLIEPNDEVEFMCRVVAVPVATPTINPEKLKIMCKRRPPSPDMND